jgi:hypothetical protein
VTPWNAVFNSFWKFQVLYIFFLKKIKERFRKERYCLGKGESQSVFCSCSFRAPIFPESNQCRLKWTARHHDSAVVALAQRHHHRGGGRFLTFSSSHLFPYRTCKNSDMYIHRSQYQYDCTRKPCGHRSDGQRPVCLPVSVGRSHFKLRGYPCRRTISAYLLLHPNQLVQTVDRAHVVAMAQLLKTRDA